LAVHGKGSDLLLGVRLPVFRRRAKRKLVAHPKFYYFDAGVFRALRPRGPFDVGEEIDGAALETLVLQELRAQNSNLGLDYELHFWRTSDGREVDFVLYGPRGLIAIEVKRSHLFREQDLGSLRTFLEDAPGGEGYLFYAGETAYDYGRIRVLPIAQGLSSLPEILHGGS
jgi:predicted AAA+ superfamily ATPase